MSEVFDVVIVGGGPGGYVAAIKAAQLGFKTACIEKRGALGGTCLNVGCIPSKALLHASEEFYKVSQSKLDKFGINIEKFSFDLDKMMKHKEDVVSSLTKGIEGLFLKNKVTYIKGAASLTSREPGVTNISVSSANEQQTVRAKHVIIATGSESISLPNIAVDEEKIVSSTGALALKSVPKKMLVIGGGYIGMEMASVWSRLGAHVTVVEYLDRVLPGMDSDISKEFKKIMTSQGIEFKLSTKVLSAEKNSKTVSVKFEKLEDSSNETLEYDVVLLSIGRKPYTQGLGLENIGVKLDERGRIDVDSHFQTSVSGVYAIGDVIKGPMLAHKAEEEGIALAEMLAGQHPHINYDAIPGIVYTHPEVASVGKAEDELKKAGIKYKASKFPFLANSRARANADTDGFVKILTDENDTLLGAHIIGANAGELIQEVVCLLEFKGSAEDLARISHGHPGLYEAVKEAGMIAAFGKTIHI